MKNLYLGLVHFPIKNKRGELVTTSVTNLDIHDIARSCKTFGVEKYFIVTPLKKQKDLVSRILGHWETDKASDYNPDRMNALSDVEVSESVRSVISRINYIEGQPPKVITTGANYTEFSGKVDWVINEVRRLDNPPCLLLFGTGWGLHKELDDLIDYRLEPIYGSPNGYNHLSVRSAVAIYLDRFSQKLND